MNRTGARPGPSAKTGLPWASRVGLAEDQGREVVVVMARRLRREEARESFASRGKTYFSAEARSWGGRRDRYGPA